MALIYFSAIRGWRKTRSQENMVSIEGGALPWQYGSFTMDTCPTGSLHCTPETPMMPFSLLSREPDGADPMLSVSESSLQLTWDMIQWENVPGFSFQRPSPCLPVSHRSDTSVVHSCDLLGMHAVLTSFLPSPPPPTYRCFLVSSSKLAVTLITDLHVSSWEDPS